MYMNASSPVGFWIRTTQNSGVETYWQMWWYWEVGAYKRWSGHEGASPFEWFWCPYKKALWREFLSFAFFTWYHEVTQSSLYNHTCQCFDLGLPRFQKYEKIIFCFCFCFINYRLWHSAIAAERNKATSIVNDHRILQLDIPFGYKTFPGPLSEM